MSFAGHIDFFEPVLPDDFLKVERLDSIVTQKLSLLQPGLNFKSTCDLRAFRLGESVPRSFIFRRSWSAKVELFQNDRSGRVPLKTLDRRVNALLDFVIDLSFIWVGDNMDGNPWVNV
jgi:hypothetical protein